MNRRIIKKREAMYRRVISAVVHGIARGDGPIRGAHAVRQVVREADAPRSVILFVEKRMRKGKLDVFFDSEGVDMWPGCSYTYFSQSQFPVEFWEGTRLFITPSPFDKAAWVGLYRKVREIAGYFGGLYFCPKGFDGDTASLPA